MLNDEATTRQLLKIPVEDFLDDPLNRKVLLDDELRQLGESMLATGQQQPATAYREGDKYRLKSGHRRLAAAKLVGMKTLEAILIPRPVGGRLVLGQMAENKARKNLSPPEEVDAVERAKRESPGMTNREMAAHTGYTESELSKRLTVAADPDARATLVSGQLSSVAEAHAYAGATPEARAKMLALKVSGASSRDVIEAAGRKARQPRKPGEQVTRVAVCLPGGVTVTLAGKEMDVEQTIQHLVECLKSARRARDENLSVKSWTAGMRDRAAKP